MKMDRTALIERIKNRLLISGDVDDHKIAEEIARRWVKA